MVILVQSLRISEESEQKLYSIINTLLKNNLISLIFYLSLLFIVILTIAKIVCDRVGSVIKVARGTIHNYLMIGGLKYEK